MNKAASQYLREVKKRIHCSRSLKTEFLFQLEDEVDFFCEDFDGVDFAALEKRFGKPEDVAKDYLSELSENAAIERRAFSRRTLYCLVIFFCVVVLGVVIYVSYLQHTLLDIQFIESITYEGELTTDVTGAIYEQEVLENKG